MPYDEMSAQGEGDVAAVVPGMIVLYVVLVCVIITGFVMGLVVSWRDKVPGTAPRWVHGLLALFLAPVEVIVGSIELGKHG